MHTSLATRGAPDTNESDTFSEALDALRPGNPELFSGPLGTLDEDGSDTISEAVDALHAGDPETLHAENLHSCSTDVDAISDVVEEEEEEITEQWQEASPPALLLPSGTLKARSYTFVTEVPMFPETSPDGKVYVVNISGLTTEEALKMHTRLQYSHPGGGSDLKTRSPFLGDIPVWRKRLICNGVKVCPQLNPRAIWTHDKNALAILRTNLGQPHLDNPQHMQYEPSLADLTYT